MVCVCVSVSVSSRHLADTAFCAAAAAAAVRRRVRGPAGLTPAFAPAFSSLSTPPFAACAARPLLLGVSALGVALATLLALPLAGDLTGEDLAGGVAGALAGDRRFAAAPDVLRVLLALRGFVSCVYAMAATAAPRSGPSQNTITCSFSECWLYCQFQLKARDGFMLGPVKKLPT